MPTPPTLSIVIVSYNAREHLENCLRVAGGDRLRRSRTKSSSWTTRRPTTASRRLRARWPHVRRSVQQRENAGFAAGNNAGIRAGHGDLRPAPQQRHGRASRRRSTGSSIGSRRTADAAVAGPRLVDADRRRGALVRSDDLAVGRAPAEDRDVAARAARGAGVGVGGAGDAAGALRGLGQRRVPAGAAGRDAERAGLLDERYLPVHRGRRLLRRHPCVWAGASCSRPRRRSSTCAAAPAPPLRRP